MFIFLQEWRKHTKTTLTTWLIFLLSFSLLSAKSSVIAQGEAKEINYSIKSSVTYVNPSGGTNVWNFTEDDRAVSLFMDNSWQTVTLLNSTFPVEAIKNDEDGNPIAVLRFPEPMLSPGQNVSFTVWYHIVSKPRTMPTITETASLDLADIPQQLVVEYTRKEGSWQTTDQTLVSFALNQKGSETNVLKIIKNFVIWIKENIKYPSPQKQHENPYYPNETYAQGEGDCDDQAILLITLCRIVGIPSYLQTGSIYLPESFENNSFWDGHLSMVERRIGWHGWAVVYIPPWGWLPVDLTYVPPGFGDPLNAIKHGAVTSQDTIQYMNVTHTDYVASSLEARTFLLNNGFQVFMEDEMPLGAQRDADGSPLTIGIDQWTLLGALVVLTAFAAISSILIFRRRRKKTVEEAPTPPDRHL